MALVIDADGHFMESFALWEHYLEPQYRECAIRMVKDSHSAQQKILGANAARLDNLD